MGRKAVIFDVDGTLCDTFRLIFDTTNDTLEPVWGRRKSDEEIEALFGPTEEALVERELDGQDLSAMMDKFYADYRRNHDRVSLYPGIPELLKGLGEMGILMGILTNKGRPTTEITLERLGIRHYFQSIRTGTEGQAKPDPRLLMDLLEELGADPGESWMVGDSPADVKAGQGAGAKVVAAAWGRPQYAGRVTPLEPTLLAWTPEEFLVEIRAGR